MQFHPSKIYFITSKEQFISRIRIFEGFRRFQEVLKGFNRLYESVDKIQKDPWSILQRHTVRDHLEIAKKKWVGAQHTPLLSLWTNWPGIQHKPRFLCPVILPVRTLDWNAAHAVTGFPPLLSLWGNWLVYSTSYDWLCSGTLPVNKHWKVISYHSTRHYWLRPVTFSSMEARKSIWITRLKHSTNYDWLVNDLHRPSDVTWGRKKKPKRLEPGKQSTPSLKRLHMNRYSSEVDFEVLYPVRSIDRKSVV